MSPRTMTAADHIRELTHGFTTATYGPTWVPIPTTERGPYRRGSAGWTALPGQSIHTVRNAALLDQLRRTVTGSKMTTDGTFHAAYGSKPAGRLDVLAFLHRIDRQSSDLATEHGIPAALPVDDRLSRLAGVLPLEPHRVVRSWWATARVLTQHDGPPYSPDVPCPVETCERHGSLRVRVQDRLAVCVECHTVWTDDTTDREATFGRLAIWIKWAAEHLSGLRHFVPATDEVGGYPEELGYRIECEECRPERLAMAQRESRRLVEARRMRVAERAAS